MQSNNYKELFIIIISVMLFIGCEPVPKYKIIEFNSGRKKMEGYLIDDKKNGVWKLWYKSGEIRGIGNYFDDKLDGEWVFWSKSGKVTDKGYFIDGKRHGEWIVNHYNKNETTLFKFYFKHDVLVDGFKVFSLRDSCIIITEGKIEYGKNNPIQITREFKVNTIKKTNEYGPSFPFMDHFTDDFIFLDSLLVEQNIK